MKKFVFIIMSVSSVCTHAMVHQDTEKQDSPSLTDSDRADKDSIIKKAINLELLATDATKYEVAFKLSQLSSQKVGESDYVSALDIIIAAITKFPKDFRLQVDLAYLLSDCAEVNPVQFISQELKDAMMHRSDEIFNKLMSEVKAQPQAEIYRFKNEFYYHFRMHREQYELGLQRVNDYWCSSEWDVNGFRGYYSQGVGAARYAQQLLKNNGNKALALDYAQKAIVAWAQYFSYKNDYYNAYVHYALALGILGYKDEMMKALERSASIIKKGLDYFEFKNVIDFVNCYC